MSAAEDPGGSALLDALDYAAAGYKVGPVTVRLKHDGTKGALFHTSWREPDGISSDPEQITAWAREHPGCGFHVPCGPNGIVVAEGDVKHDSTGRRTADGIASWRQAGGPRSPMTVTTRSGGEHWYFRAPAEPIRNSAGAVENVPHVDVRGDGGTVFTSGTVVQGGGGHYAATRIVPVGELPALPPAWEHRLRAAGPSPRPDRERRSASQSAARTRLVDPSAIHDRDWITARVDDELRELAARGTADFRARLAGCAAVVTRAVDLKLLDPEEAEARLAAAVRAVWNAPPDADDRAWIADGRRIASEDPWRLAVEDESASDDQDGKEDKDTPPASWSPVDLGPHLNGTHETPVATLLERADGVALLYLGLVHWVYGESESGKSWVCLVAVARALLAGGRALFVDYESDPGAVTGRLRALGVPVEAIRAGLVYVRPETSCANEPVAFAELLAQRFDVAVVDGVTEGLGIEGGASVDNDDVTAWVRRIPRRIAIATGAAVACVDHVTKDKEGRGRFPIGGQAKLAALDGAGYLVEPESAIRPGAVGEIVLRVAKDRPGGVRAHAGEWRSSDRTQEAARITLDATDPTAITVTVAAPKTRDGAASGAGFRPTVYMERVSRFLATTEGEVATRAIEGAVDGRADLIRRALDELALLGYVTRRQGPRNAVLYTHERRYSDLQRVVSGEELTEPDD